MRVFDPAGDRSATVSPVFDSYFYMTSRSTQPDVQTHLYSAFLAGRTPDVALRVRGSWEGVYRLHRVVLIQADFFRLLFDGGFRESNGQLGSLDEVNVTFDDPNITRAAFEICISRLYGGGPALHVDPRLIPSRKEPLTPSFPHPYAPIKAPAGHHPATPRFLLSLVATAIYLGIPSLVSQALLLVLNSIGPYTIVRYLNFAIGLGIGEIEDIESEAAVGLEDVCSEPSYQASSRASSIRSRASVSTATCLRDGLSIPHKEDPTDTDTVHSYQTSAGGDDGPLFTYGSVSNKIGEAAACWLCRWAADMLMYEEAADLGSEESATKLLSDAMIPPACTSGKNLDVAPRIWRRSGMNAAWVRAVLSADAFFVRDECARYDLAKRAVELRRRVSVDDAEESEWDSLFSDGIHYMHMALDDLMEISQDISPTTGRTYAPASVIRAAHWDQSVLRHHINHRPSSSSSPTTPPRSPGLNGDSLGLMQTTSEILSELSAGSSGGDPHKIFHPVPIDSSSRLGDITGLDGASMEQLFGSGSGSEGSTSSASSVIKGKVRAPNPHTPADFFGIGPARRAAAECALVDTNGTQRWARFPPLRFGTEFWGIGSLQDREKARLTSQTVWYAGSLFNVYVQLVRRKSGSSAGAIGSSANTNGGLQLGMYVHRLSSVETIPAPSAPPTPRPTSPTTYQRSHAHSNSHGDATPSALLRTSASPPLVTIPSSFSTPTLHRPASRGTLTQVASRNSLSSSPPPSSGGMSISTNSGSPNGSNGSSIRPPAQPYRDPREAVRAHFTLLVSAPSGAALTRFASEPDAFYVGRSWGYKASAAQTEEHLGPTGTDYEEEALLSSRRECSLRATVVLGVV